MRGKEFVSHTVVVVVMRLLRADVLHLVDATALHAAGNWAVLGQL